jgi:hypothetical protein
MKVSYFILFVALFGSGISKAQITYTGKQPGRAGVIAGAGKLVLENEVLRMEFLQANRQLYLSSFEDRQAGKKLALPPQHPLFICTLRDGTALSSLDFVAGDKVQVADLAPVANDPVFSSGLPGKKLSVSFTHEGRGLTVHWRAELRDGSNYVKQFLELATKDSIHIEKITPINLPAWQGLKKMGTVDGSPLVLGTMFFSVESPLSQVAQGATNASISLFRSFPLTADRNLTVSNVWGVTPNQQLRRGFLYYMERERAKPYRQFLHYNSWYDLSWEDRTLNDSLCLDRIKVFGDSLIVKRGVTMNAFLFDDGWDDYKTLWQFNKGFPNGFTNLRNAAAKYDAGIGVWMSPWGGYDIRKPQRLEYGARQQPPFETNENGFSLAGPVYYERFSSVTQNFLNKYGVSIFKFDGVGAGNGANGSGAQYQKDVESLLRLIGEIRHTKPDIFLSLTIGTWPSVYWLKHGDVIWRAGDDTGIRGKGTKRQQWMNYRDAQTYQNVVKRAPFYPLSALMYHGLCIADQGIPGKLNMDLKDIEDEIWSFFGTGTSLQEMYVNPHKLKQAHWDCLKDAINWSRDHAHLMPDVHWIGGDPAKEDIYGYAAWNEQGGYFTLRNPAATPKTFVVNATEIFDLPSGVNKAFTFYDARTAAKSAPGKKLATGSSFTIVLQPFEFKLINAIPNNK